MHGLTPAPRLGPCCRLSSGAALPSPRASAASLRATRATVRGRRVAFAGRNGCRPIKARPSPLLLVQLRLRAHPSAVMLDRKDVAVEGRDPLLTLHGHLEITQCVAEIALDLTPIELRIVVDQIRRTAVAQLLVNAGFDKFVIERVELARVERIAQLADQIAGPDQARLRIGSGVVVVIGYREARELDGARDPLLVYER